MSNYKFIASDKRLANTLKWITNIQYVIEKDYNGNGEVYIFRDEGAKIVKEVYFKLKDMRNYYHDLTKNGNYDIV